MGQHRKRTMGLDWYSTHQTIWAMSGVYAGMACIISFYLVFQHLRHFTEPRFQKPIVRIILMIPVYCIDSWLSLSFYDIYEFFVLLVQFLDGEENLIAILEMKSYQSHPWPFCFLPKLKLGRSFYVLCKRCVLQFVIIKPILAILTFCMEITGVYHMGSFDFTSGYLYITAVDNVSITIAVYFLILFYTPIYNELSPFRPIPKFLCIKIVIFFSFWQDVLISLLVWTDVLKAQPGWSVDNLSDFIQNALICVEMFILSFFIIYAFGFEYFLDPNVESILKTPKSAIKPIIKNFGAVINPRDEE